MDNISRCFMILAPRYEGSIPSAGFYLRTIETRRPLNAGSLRVRAVVDGLLNKEKQESLKTSRKRMMTDCNHQFACQIGEWKCLEEYTKNPNKVNYKTLCSYCHYRVYREAIKEQVEDPHPAIPEELQKKYIEVNNAAKDLDMLFYLHLDMEKNLVFFTRLSNPILKQGRYLMEQFEKTLFENRNE